jgi:hypothetical protein
MASPDDAAVGGVDQTKMRQKIALGMDGKAMRLRTLSEQDLATYPRGEHGASLKGEEEGPLKKAKAELQADLVTDEFLEGLRKDKSKIQELMAKLGETREQVSIVAHTADGGITRMLLEKRDGRYVEVSEGKGVNETKKTKPTLQEDDLLIFEKGAKTNA